MKGDYYRYMAEYKENEELESMKEEALIFYTLATELSEELLTTNPIRLEVALNFSVFYYEIMHKPTQAC